MEIMSTEEALIELEKYKIRFVNFEGDLKSEDEGAPLEKGKAKNFKFFLETFGFPASICCDGNRIIFTKGEIELRHHSVHLLTKKKTIAQFC